MQKFLVLGHAGHGKDSVAKLLCDMYKTEYVNTTLLFAELEMFKNMNRLRRVSEFGDTPPYLTAEECHADRDNCRSVWYEAIACYCSYNKTRLADEVYARTNVYIGARAQDELEAIIEKFNPIIIFVDASKRLPLENSSSYKIDLTNIKHTVINNNSGPDGLSFRLEDLIRHTTTTKWDSRFINLAKIVATWSKDKEGSVGAVLASQDRRSLAVGYSGTPTGLDGPRETYTIHAELNAILNCHVRPDGWTMYTTKAPCSECAKAIIQSGIAVIVCPLIDPYSQWAKSQSLALKMFRDANLCTIYLHDDIFSLC